MLDKEYLFEHFSADKVEQMEKLYSDAGWRGALTIITSKTFINDGRVWKYVDLSNRAIDFEEILKDNTFSWGEKTLMQIAASIFNGSTHINLYATFGGLDGWATALALQAIAECGNPGQIAVIYSKSALEEHLENMAKDRCDDSDDEQWKREKSD